MIMIAVLIKTQIHGMFVRIAIIIAVLTKQRNMVFHSPNCKDCDHDCNLIKTQKYDIFVRTVIMVAVLTIRTRAMIAVLIKT